MTQLNPVNNYEAFYDWELSSPVEEASDPFMARDLDIDMSTSVAGRVLKKVADDEAYDLEIVDKWPYVFSREGNEVYSRLEESSFSDESVEIGRRLMQVLETGEVMSEGDVEKVTDYLVDDRREFSTKVHRRGETKDLLRETPEIEYSLEDGEFSWVQ